MLFPTKKEISTRLYSNLHSHGTAMKAAFGGWGTRSFKKLKFDIQIFL